MEIGDSFRQRIEDQIGVAVTKYFDGGIFWSGHRAESQRPLFRRLQGSSRQRRGVARRGRGDGSAVGFRCRFRPIEKRLRRYKRKLKDHHAGNHLNNGFAEVAYTVMDGMPDHDEEVADDFAPAIVAESTKQLKTMSVATAVMALDMTDEPLLLFRSPGKDELNIVYRRQDGNIGWIDAANIKG